MPDYLRMSAVGLCATLSADLTWILMLKYDVIYMYGSRTHWNKIIQQKLQCTFIRMHFEVLNEEFLMHVYNHYLRHVYITVRELIE